MDWLQTTQGIIALISSAVVLVGALITTGTMLWSKVKEIAQLIKDKKYGEVIAKLKNTADATIRSVENSKLSGADKKTTVLEAVQAAAQGLGVEFTDELKNDMSKFIDDSVAEYNQFRDANKK